MSHKTIVAFGDSITRGHTLAFELVWPHLLREKLREALSDPQLTVINSGGNGNTSRQGLARMDADVLAHKPSLVTIEFGGNDATDEVAKHVPDEEVFANLKTIAQKAAAAGAKAVFVTFPPVVNDWHRRGRYPCFDAWGGFDGRVEPNRQAARDLAESMGAGLFDLDLFVRAEAAKRGWEAVVAPDGVHLTVLCNELVAEAIFPVVYKALVNQD